MTRRKKGIVKRFVSVLLTIVMLVSVVSSTGFIVYAAEVIASGTSGEVSWELNSDGKFTVSGTGAMADYASADEVPWKDNATSITSVNIGSDVTSVGAYAFAGCNNLTEVILGEGVWYIGSYAFYDCVKLEQVVIPMAVKSMGYGAFGLSVQDSTAGLKNVYIYSRAMEFEYNSEYSDAETLPKHTVINGYSSTDAEYYTGRNERTFKPLTDGYILNIMSSDDSTYAFDRDSDYVVNLWKHQIADNNSSDSMKFDYTITLDATEALKVHNSMVTSSANIIGDGYNNDGQIEVEVELVVDENEMSIYKLCLDATYGYSENDLLGEAKDNYHKWDIYGDDMPIVSATGNDTELTIKFKGTLKDVYDYVAEKKGDTNFRIDQTYFSVTVYGKTYKIGSSGTSIYERNSEWLEYESVWFYDAHGRNADVERVWAMTMQYPIKVTDIPLYEKEGFYEPVKKEYVWNYEISRIGDYDETLDRCWGEIGYDSEKSEGVFTEENEGVIYGRVIGTYNAGSNAILRINDLLTDENKDFINSLKGVEPRGCGGQASILLNCTVTLTFEDGEVIVLDTMSGDEMTYLVSPCMHACSVCGLCTEKEERLPCNFNIMMGDMPICCMCEEPGSSEVTSIRVDEAKVTVENNTYADTITITVDQIDISLSGDSAYVEHVTSNVEAYQTVEIFNIDVFDGYGNPYTLNQYGGEENLTITIPVSEENAQAVNDGEAKLYHIDGDGKSDEVPITANITDCTITFTWNDFSPFVLVKEVKSDYYGRNTLKDMTNSTALLFAYDAIVSGISNSEESITVYNGVDTFSASDMSVVMDAYRRDHAEHFWFTGAYKMISTVTDIVSIEPTYTLEGTELETAKTKFDKVAKEILSGITVGMTEYEKELYLHDELAKKVSYVDGDNAHNSYGALVDGEAVCEGYAKALQYLLQQVGIQSFIALGTSVNIATGNSEAHAWNYVRIDDKYYHVDLTWDDQGEELYHMYFNQSDAIIKEDHTIEAAAYALPVCESKEAFYYYNKDANLATYTAKTVGELLKNNEGKAYVYIPGDVDQFAQWYLNNVSDIVTEAGVIGSVSCGYSKLGREFIITVSDKISYGDINSDGVINISDAVAIKKHLAGIAGEYDLAASDLNADGVVDTKDAVKLMKHLAGMTGIELGKAS